MSTAKKSESQEPNQQHVTQTLKTLDKSSPHTSVFIFNKRTGAFLACFFVCLSVFLFLFDSPQHVTACDYFPSQEQLKVHETATNANNMTAILLFFLLFLLLLDIPILRMPGLKHIYQQSHKWPLHEPANQSVPVVSEELTFLVLFVFLLALWLRGHGCTWFAACSVAPSLSELRLWFVLRGAVAKRTG